MLVDEADDAAVALAGTARCLIAVVARTVAIIGLVTLITRKVLALVSGLISQQLANEPGVPYGEGAFSRLTGTAIDLFLSAYAPAGTAP